MQKFQMGICFEGDSEAPDPQGGHRGGDPSRQDSAAATIFGGMAADQLSARRDRDGFPEGMKGRAGKGETRFPAGKPHLSGKMVEHLGK